MNQVIRSLSARSKESHCITCGECDVSRRRGWRQRDQKARIRDIEVEPGSAASEHRGQDGDTVPDGRGTGPGAQSFVYEFLNLVRHDGGHWVLQPVPFPALCSTVPFTPRPQARPLFVAPLFVREDVLFIVIKALGERERPEPLPVIPRPSVNALPRILAGSHGPFERIPDAISVNTTRADAPLIL